MPKDAVAVEMTGPHRLRLTFEDGVSGEVDVARLVAFEGVFAPLADPEQFRTVCVSADAGTVVWPNGADLDPPPETGRHRHHPTPHTHGRVASPARPDRPASPDHLPDLVCS